MQTERIEGVPARHWHRLEDGRIQCDVCPRACRDRGLKNVAVTAGYVCAEACADLFAPMAAANVDLKAFTEGFYRKLCTGALQPVLDTLLYLKRETDVWLEVTTLLIPGENDSEAEIEALCAWFADHLGPDVPLHFTAFHPDWKMLDKPRTPAGTLARARSIAMREGLRYVYTGNVHDEPGQSTYCHACGTTLIGREGYDLTAWALTPDGRCAICGAPCAGVFEPRPGSWGGRRMPLGIRTKGLPAAAEVTMF